MTNTIDNSVVKTPKKNKHVGKKVAIYILLILGGFMFALPFFWMLSTSFKEYAEIAQIPITWIPRKFIIENYKKVFELKELAGFDVIRGFINTMIIVIPSTVIGILTAAGAAFAFAKIKFPGRDKIFGCLVATMAIPGVVTMIPSYMLFSIIGWNNTWLPLMIPGMLGGAGAIFFTRQFMKGIPKSLEESAKIDGMGWWGIFWKIEVPLAAPVLITNFMFGFLGGYNDYVGPALYLSGADTSKYTLQLVISLISQTDNTSWGMQMAACCMAVIPSFLLFIFAQRFFIEGIAISGMKD